MPDLEIRLLDSASAMEGIEDLQAEIWPGSPVDIVPTHVLLTAAHNGGLVLGAFRGGHMVGMLFGFPGLDQTGQGFKTKHCSHMLGVLPEFRDSGLGFALKARQRELLLAQGLDHATWTYDPLLSRNAWLNIHRLGAVCKAYRRSEYGPMRDKLNTGIDSDRFQVDWWLSSTRVASRVRSLSGSKSMHLVDLLNSQVFMLAAGEGMNPPHSPMALTASTLLIEIPPDFQAIREINLPLAREWRTATRMIFENAFAAGLVLTDFLYENGRSFYLLGRDDIQIQD